MKQRKLKGDGAQTICIESCGRMRNFKRSDKFWLTGLSIMLGIALFVLACAPVRSQVGEGKGDRPSTPNTEPRGKGKTGTGAKGKVRGSRGKGRSEKRTLSDESASTKAMLPPLDTQPYDFKVANVNAKGVATELRGRQAQYFSQDLGGGVTLEMVQIPANTFQMGTAESEAQQVTAELQRHCKDDNCRAARDAEVKAEMPQHQVTVPAFFMGKFEVTQEQWLAVAKMPKVHRELSSLLGNPSKFRTDVKNPVEWISWEDAKEFCERLKQQTGRNYRLPTEAEWEYAARAGTTTPFAFGDTIRPELVSYHIDYPYGEAQYKEVFRNTTRRTGMDSTRDYGGANEFGLYDMHGNVWEWCEDAWHENYQGAPANARAWGGEGGTSVSPIGGRRGRASARFVPNTGGGSISRVVRGGAWDEPASRCRSASRHRLPAQTRAANVGFRVVMDDPRAASVP